VLIFGLDPAKAIFQTSENRERQPVSRHISRASLWPTHQMTWTPRPTKDIGPVA